MDWKGSLILGLMALFFGSVAIADDPLINAYFSGDPEVRRAPDFVLSVPDGGAAPRMEFTRAIDRLGVIGNVEWTSDLTDPDSWSSEGVTIQPGAVVDGRQTVLATFPPQAAGSVFFARMALENPPPVPDARPVAGTDEGPISLDLLSGASDAGGEAHLVIAAVAGDAANLGQPIAVDGGTLTINADGTGTFTPDPALPDGQTQQVLVAYLIEDALGETADGTLTVNLTGTNQLPVTTDDAVSVPELPGTPGLNYGFYHVSSGATVNDIVNGTPVATGTLPTFDLGPRDRDDFFGFEFTGFVDIPTAGTWTFFTVSDDASTLHVGETLVVDNQAIQPPTERSGSIDLPAGPQPITVRFAEQEGGEFLDVLWEGPGTPKAGIPAEALFRTLEHPADPLSLLANDTDIDTGETTQLVVSAINGESADVGQPVALSHGILVINPDGTGTYAPDGSLPAGATAQEVVAYTVSDPQGGTATGTLTLNLTGVNNAPTDNPAVALTVTEKDGPIALDPAAFTLDVDPGDTFTLTEIAGQAVTPGASIPLARGTLTIGSDGSLAYAPGPDKQSLAEGATASEMIAYAGFDAGGLPVSGLAEVVITGVNDAPTAQPDRLDMRFTYYDHEFFYVDIYEGDFSTLEDITNGTLVSRRIVHSTAPVGEVIRYTGPEPTNEYGVVITGSVNLLYPNLYEEGTGPTERTVTHTLTIENATQAGLTVVPGTQHLPNIEEWPDLMFHYGTDNPALEWTAGSLSANLVTDGTISRSQVIPVGTNAAGDFEIRYRVEAGGPAPTVTYALDDPEHPPVTPGEIFIGQVGSPDVIDLRLNDLDPDVGDELTVTHVDGVPFAPADGYFDGVPGDWAYVPDKGSFLRLPDGRLRFDAFSAVVRAYDDPERFVERTFNVTVADGLGQASTAALTVSWEPVIGLSIGSVGAEPGAVGLSVANGYGTDLDVQARQPGTFLPESFALPALSFATHEFLSPATGVTLQSSWTTPEGVEVQHYRRDSGEDAFRFYNPTGETQSFTFSFPDVVANEPIELAPYSSRVRHFPDFAGTTGGIDFASVVFERTSDQVRLAYRRVDLVDPLSQEIPATANPRSSTFGLRAEGSDGIFSYFFAEGASGYGVAPTVVQVKTAGARAYSLAAPGESETRVRGAYNENAQLFLGPNLVETQIPNIQLVDEFRDNVFITADCSDGDTYHFTARNDTNIEARLTIQPNSISVVVPRRSTVPFTHTLTGSQAEIQVRVGEQLLGTFLANLSPCTTNFGLSVTGIFEFGDVYYIRVQNDSSDDHDIRIVSRQIQSIDATGFVEAGTAKTVPFPMDTVTPGTEADLLVVDDGLDIYVLTFTLSPF